MEDLLKTEYKIYSNQISGQDHIGCDEYSIPHEISQHVDLIMPTLHFDTKIVTDPAKPRTKRDRPQTRDLGLGALGSLKLPKSLLHGLPTDPWLPKKGPIVKGPGAQPDAQKPQSSSLGNCDSQITPDCLRALYNITNGTLQKSSYGIVEYTLQAYVQADLNLFYQDLAKEIPKNTAPILQSIDGGVVQSTNKGFDYNGESDLDVQYAMALGESLIREKDVTRFSIADL